jgi:hypothetical protein
MVMDDLRPYRQGSAGKLLVVFLTLAGAAGAAGFLLLPCAAPPTQTPAAATNQVAQPADQSPLFRDWPKPDIALVITGQAYGYLQPCGCSEPQKGGLARRYNCIQMLKNRGWNVIAADVGDVAGDNSPQSRLKYRYAMKSMQLMDYCAVGVGEKETLQPLGDCLGELLNEQPVPRVLAANLKNIKQNFPGMVDHTAVKNQGKEIPIVGFTSVVAPSVAAKVKDIQVKFDSIDDILPKMVAQLKAAKAELLVLLLQGSLEEAKNVAQKYPEFQLIVCLDESDEPSGKPEEVRDTRIVRLGHKAKYVGIVGVNRAQAPQKPHELRYELIALEPEYETPKEQEGKNPIHKLMQEYADDVKRGDYLSKWYKGSHSVQVQFPEAKYVGSDQCKACHPAAYAVWEKHPHSHAYDALVKATRPTQRQFDGECIVCHTVGFKYKTGFESEKKTPDLLNVGCESCHGPGSEHANDKNNLQLRAAMNPFKIRPGENQDKWEIRIGDACASCHDTDNSVHFNFPTYWKDKKTAHPTPRKDAAQAKK